MVTRISRNTKDNEANHYLVSSNTNLLDLYDARINGIYDTKIKTNLYTNGGAGPKVLDIMWEGSMVTLVGEFQHIYQYDIRQLG